MATGGREDELRTTLLDYAGRVGEPHRADLEETEPRALVGIPIEIGDMTQSTANVG